MQHLEYPLRVKTCVDDATGVFEGYASVFGQLDHQHEIVAPGAFKKTLAYFQKSHQMPKMLWQHDPAMPIGTWEEIREDDYGLYVRGRLLLDIQRGKDAHALLKSGVVEGLSIGFQVKRSHRENTARVLDEVDLFEISLVTFMANPLAKVTACKSWIDDYTPTVHFVKRLRALRQALDRAARRAQADCRASSYV